MLGRLPAHLLIIALVALAILLSPPIDGYATHYAPSLFERVALARGLPSADCYIASDWHPLGSRVLIEGRRTGASARSPTYRPHRTGRGTCAMGLFELDARSAQAVCGAAFAGPWRRCPIVVRGVGVYQVRGSRYV